MVEVTKEDRECWAEIEVVDAGGFSSETGLADTPEGVIARYREAALATAQAENEALRARVAELDWWIGAAKALAEREAEYRKAHDLHGDDSKEAGRAWDFMRRQGDRIRQALQVNHDRD